MNEDYKEIRFGHEAIDYIEECLKEGGKSLAKYILQYQTLKAGQVTTALPSYVTHERAIDFKSGPHKEPPRQKLADGTEAWWVGITVTDFHVIDEIKSYLLGGGESRICIFEDYCSSKSDPWLKNLKNSKILFLNEELYHFLSQKDATDAVIKKTIQGSESAWPPLIGVMTSYPSKTFQDMEEIKETDLEILAQRMEKMIIGAYDMEGYLIWRKK